MSSVQVWSTDKVLCKNDGHFTYPCLMSQEVEFLTSWKEALYDRRGWTILAQLVNWGLWDGTWEVSWRLFLLIETSKPQS